MKIKTKIKILRHSSLRMNINDKTSKLKSCTYDSKLGFLVQIIKVKNMFLIHILLKDRAWWFRCETRWSL